MNYDNLLDSLKAKERADWTQDNEHILLEPYDYLSTVPGKEIRPALIDAFNAWLQVPDESLALIKLIVQQLHTASLLMDDVEDGSLLRRGIPVAHKIYGIPQTINSANYVYFLALNQLAQLHGSTSIQLFLDINEELLNLHRGQGIELYWREHLQCPTEAEYVSMVNNKTGGLFRIAIKLMLASARSGIKEDLLPLVNLIGILFQIQDDYRNLQSESYSSNKGFCEDLTEGKFSFPIVHAIRNSSNRRLLNVLKQRPTDYATKAWAVSYMQDATKSFEYTHQVVLKLKKQAVEEIARLGGHPGLMAILDLIVPDAA